MFQCRMIWGRQSFVGSTDKASQRAQILFSIQWMRPLKRPRRSDPSTVHLISHLSSLGAAVTDHVTLFPLRGNAFPLHEIQLGREKSAARRLPSKRTGFTLQVATFNSTREKQFFLVSFSGTNLSTMITN